MYFIFESFGNCLFLIFLGFLTIFNRFFSIANSGQVKMLILKIKVKILCQSWYLPNFIQFYLAVTELSKNKLILTHTVFCINVIINTILDTSSYTYKENELWVIVPIKMKKKCIIELSNSSPRKRKHYSTVISARITWAPRQNLLVTSHVRMWQDFA